MAEPAPTKRMNAQEFAVWEQTQVERHELVDGVPQLKFVEWDGPKMRVGATNRHNLIVGNVFFRLKGQLPGSKCRSYAADGKINIPEGNIRYGDVSIDCEPLIPDSSDLSSPVAVVEVFSKSTRWMDQNKKLHEYQTVPSLRYILLLLQSEMRGHLWTRTASGWDMQELIGADAIADFATIHAQFTLGEAYEDAL